MNVFFSEIKNKILILNENNLINFESFTFETVSKGKFSESFHFWQDFFLC